MIERCLVLVQVGSAADGNKIDRSLPPLHSFIFIKINLEIFSNFWKIAFSFEEPEKFVYRRELSKSADAKWVFFLRQWLFFTRTLFELNNFGCHKLNSCTQSLLKIVKSKLVVLINKLDGKTTSLLVYMVLEYCFINSERRHLHMYQWLLDDSCASWQLCYPWQGQH